MGIVIALAGVAMMRSTAPTTLPPSGKWAIAYEPSECLLTRQFGLGDRLVTLGLLRFPTSPGGTLLLVTSGEGAEAGRGSEKASGQATNCKIVKTSGGADLDRQTCAITERRARISRAAEGAAPTHWVVLPVNWSLPTG